MPRWVGGEEEEEEEEVVVAIHFSRCLHRWLREVVVEAPGCSGPIWGLEPRLHSQALGDLEQGSGSRDKEDNSRRWNAMELRMMMTMATHQGAIGTVSSVNKSHPLKMCSRQVSIEVFKRVVTLLLKRRV